MTPRQLRSSPWLLILAMGPLLGPIATAVGQSPQALVINGSYYKQLVQMKDLIADVLPPPAYIIEAQLTVLRMIDLAEIAMEDGKISADEAKVFDGMVEYGRQLKDGAPGVFPGYVERIEAWKKDLTDATSDEKLIKKLLTVKSAEPALKFFEVRDTKFVPLIKAGDVNGAKAIARNELKPLYLEHRGAIDGVVTRARRLTEKIEKVVAEKAASAEAGDAELRLKGPLYNKVILMKDLVSDILPPPNFIIESYLTVLQQIDECEVAMSDGSISAEEREALTALVEYGRQLEAGDSNKGEMAGYRERIAFWVVDLQTDTPERKTIKELTTKLCCEPALKFYEIRNGAFQAAIGKAAIAEAKQIVRRELGPLYEAHRKQVDVLVAAANTMYAQVQAKVDGLLAAPR